MKKLNNKKVRHIINQLEKGEPTAKLSTIYKVSQRRIQQLYDQYERTDIVPVLKACGRKKRIISQEIIGVLLYFAINCYSKCFGEDYNLGIVDRGCFSFFILSRQ